MTDSYQAIYDAVRSRISNGNVGEVVREVAWQALDIGFARQMLQEQIGAVGFEMTRPSVLFRPAVSLDGNMFCALYGEDLMNGCAGFGKTLGEAMADFDKNWADQKAPSVSRDNLCEACDGYGRIYNNADETSGQFVDCDKCGQGS